MERSIGAFTLLQYIYKIIILYTHECVRGSYWIPFVSNILLDTVWLAP